MVNACSGMGTERQVAGTRLQKPVLDKWSPSHATQPVGRDVTEFAHRNVK